MKAELLHLVNLVVACKSERMSRINISPDIHGTRGKYSLPSVLARVGNCVVNEQQQS
jgi:hypothetical protein